MTAVSPGPRALAFRLAEGITRERAELEIHARRRAGDDFVLVPEDEFAQLRDLHTRSQAVTAELERTDRELDHD